MSAGLELFLLKSENSPEDFSASFELGLLIFIFSNQGYHAITAR